MFHSTFRKIYSSTLWVEYGWSWFVFNVKRRKHIRRMTGLARSRWAFKTINCTVYALVFVTCFLSLLLQPVVGHDPGEQFQIRFSISSLACYPPLLQLKGWLWTNCSNWLYEYAPIWEALARSSALRTSTDYRCGNGRFPVLACSVTNWQC